MPKAAEVPIIIAVNKIDLPDANPMKVKQELYCNMKSSLKKWAVMFSVLRYLREK